MARSRGPLTPAPGSLPAGGAEICRLMGEGGPRGAEFRRWATGVLSEYLEKGFAIDDDRLRDGGGRYFRELLQRVRDIRSSGRNFLQQICDVLETSADYDAARARALYAGVRDGAFAAACGMTAPEVVCARCDRDRPLLGMESFEGGYVIEEDAVDPKNYLDARERQRLNLLAARVLDYAELQALEGRPMTMGDWERELASQLDAMSPGAGLRLAGGERGAPGPEALAAEHAREEFRAYRAREMAELVSDHDRFTAREPGLHAET